MGVGVRNHQKEMSITSFYFESVFIFKRFYLASILWLYVWMVEIWQLKFNPLPTIQLSWNFAGVRSLDDNTIFIKKN